MKKHWEQLINLGNYNQLSEQALKRLHIVNSISVIAFTSTSIALLLNYIFSNFILTITCIVTLAFFGLILWANIRRYYTFATFFFLISPFLFSFAQVFSYGNAMEIEYIFLLTPIVGFLFFEERRYRFSIFVAAIAAMLILKLMYVHHQPLYEAHHPFYLEIVTAISTMIVGFIVIHLFQKDTQKAREQMKDLLKSIQLVNSELSQKEKELTEKNLELEAEVELRWQAVEAYQESEKRYQMLFENGFDGVMVFDLDSRRVVSCNQKMLEFFEARRAELLQLDIRDVWGNFDQSNTKAEKLIQHYLERTRKDGKMTFVSMFRSRMGNKIAAQVTAVLLPAPNDHMAIAIFKNVTNQWNAKEKILEANKELKNFAHAASHDLREPLRMIHSFGQLLGRRNKHQFDDQSKEFLHFIIDASKRMTTLTQDLLEYATTGTDLNESKVINLDNTLFMVLNNLRLKIEETQAKISHHPLPTIEGHPTLITQLFQNIISNSLKFQKKNISPEVKITVEPEENQWLFSIQDNGIGIAPEHQERIFEVFRRLHSKAQYEGSGIGLATCKKIIDKYGGRIWVESEFGKGTTFFFTLPKKKLKKHLIIPSMETLQMA